MQIKSRLELGGLMRHLQLPMVAVECGVAEGRWSESLLNMGVEKLYLIDIWETVPFLDGCASREQEWHDSNYESVKSKFKDKPKVILLKGFSYKMAAEIPDNSVGMVYIDANHEYLGAYSDAEIFWEKLVKNGVLAFHDAANPEYGVWRAIRDFANKENREVHQLIEDGNVVNIGAYIIK